jgi:uncharacterized protein
MKEVFADSFYFIALLNRHDQHHVRAAEIAGNLQFRLVTTHWVLVEVADAFSAPTPRQRAARFVEEALAGTMAIVVSDPVAWLEQGLKLYSARPDKDWSLTDCISFSVMQARGIREALTGDQDFAQAGFIPLLAPRSS